jgi:hypothetical protein
MQVQQGNHRGRLGKSKVDMEFGQNERRMCHDPASRFRRLKVSLSVVWSKSPFLPKSCSSSQDRFIPDDCAQGNTHALTCSPDSTGDRLARSHHMRHCRSLPCSGCSTATLSIPPPKSVCFSSSRSRGSVQPLDNCLGLIGDDDQLDLHRIWFLGPFQGSKWLTLRARLLLFPFSKKLKCVAQCGVICFLLSTREIREDFHSLLQ